MTQGRTGSTGDDRPATADLLQLWISGGADDDAESADGDAAAAPGAPTDTAPETASDAGSSQDSPDDLAAPTAAEPVDAEVDTSGDGTAQSRAAQRWWPADDDGGDEPAADAATAAAEPTEKPQQWWPYQESGSEAAENVPTDEAPALDVPSSSTEAEVDDTEWSEADEAAAHPDDSSEASTSSRTSDESSAESPQTSGWASFGPARTAEDVLGQLDTTGAWSTSPTRPTRQPSGTPTAESVDEPEGAAQSTDEADVAADETAAPEEQATAPSSLDLTETTHWSLDDFESYIRTRGSSDVADLFRDEPAPSAPETQPEPEPEAVDEPEPALEPEPADAPAATDTADRADSPDTPDTADTWVADDFAEPDVAWEGEAAAAGPQVVEPVPEETPTAPAASEAAVAPSPSSGWDPDATEYFDWTIDTDAATDAAPVAEVPVAAESTGAPAATSTTAEPEGDHQEWFDDHGLRWVSDDGGYTWFSDDGQGWNAEVGEPIDVPADRAPVAAPAASTEAAPLFRDEVQDEPAPASDEATQAWPTPAKRSLADEMWAPTTAPEQPTTAAGADDLWPSSTTADVGTPAAGAPATSLTPAVAAPAAAATAGTAATEAEPGGIPPFVEYKPRGAYRPLLGVLFVLAAILAVVAIFWAVSKGSQTATGIAAGVTGFALAFWWGLLSWTPTIVSVSGSILEVARGQDGERFDLRSPRLVIDVDDDVHSRNWRTTITRPNGTELVIPATAVEPEEFTRIVKHYRAEAGR